MYQFVPRFLLGFSLAIFAFAGISGCHRVDPDATPIADNSGPDPADANLAPVDTTQPQPASAPASVPAQGRVLPARAQAQPVANRRTISPTARSRPDGTASAALRSGLSGRAGPRSARRRRRTPTRRIRRPTSSGTPRVRPARSPRTQLHLDPWLLVLGTCGLLLDTRRMVFSALLRSSLDPRLLGLVPQPLGLPPRILGHSHWLLRRHQLWLRLHRLRLSRRLLERKQLLLQPLCQSRQRQHHSRL